MFYSVSFYLRFCPSTLGHERFGYYRTQYVEDRNDFKHQKLKRLLMIHRRLPKIVCHHKRCAFPYIFAINRAQ